jgi:hypothetical protein
MIKITALVAAGSLALVGLTGCASATDSAAPDSTTAASSSPVASDSSSESAAAPKVTTSPKAPLVDEGIATADETVTQLTYLIEEEKLAHDVYQAMFDIWGSRVFGNILNSEESHQSQVLAVMATRDIADPRSSQLGVFKNAELQKLYDELIAKGSKSAVDAYEVGVAIEVLDIDDLTKMLATAKDADVIAMMENLRKGSENHLRAFNNQLNK